MEVKQVLRMNCGDGHESYAQNSAPQRFAIMKAKPILEATIEELCRSGLPEWLRIAELGCSVGPNTLLGVEEIINNIDRTCDKLNLEKPSVEVFLNDLERNDFNTVFKSLPNFYEKLEKTTNRKSDSCFVAALPGSFYGRLFPTRSIHLANSSNSLQWLSQVPPGLVNELGEHLNKENIYIAKSSPPSVQKAYLDQFVRDFSLFLKVRYEEMVPKGRIVINIIGKDDHNYDPRSMIGSILHGMVKERSAVLKAKSILEGTIEELCWSGVPEYFRIAELGCSAGPNTLIGVEEIINNIDKACEKLNLEKPSVEIFLNDLVGNDFNTVFKSLPNFYEKLEKLRNRKSHSCFVAALPGSFYGRLFPSRSIHFANCSNCLHWLSQIPLGLVSELGEHLNKENIYIAKSSPASVEKAYLDQFEKDFSLFLRMRSEELVPKGHLVLTMISKNNDDYDTRAMIGSVLHGMVKEGLIKEADLESFNLPLYSPSAEKVQDMIEKEGSFKILHLQTFKQRWSDIYKEDDNKGNRSKGEYSSMFVRAVFEPILASHFGEAMMDELFTRCSNTITQYMEIGQGSINNVVVSLVKNAQVGYDVQEA